MVGRRFGDSTIGLPMASTAEYEAGVFVAVGDMAFPSTPL